MRYILRLLVVTIALVPALAATAAAATLSPALEARLASAAPGDSVGTVIVAFTSAPLDAAHLTVLGTAGITSGRTLPTLGMVAVDATAAQVRTLARSASVRSIWSNDALDYDMHEARVLTGVDRLRSDGALTKINGGLPVSGRGVSVVVNDSGIDGLHADLPFPSHVVQNVQIVADTSTLTGFTPLVALENVPNTDTHVGHGTHVAGIVGGTGQASGGLYQGVAPGARLIGTGSGAGLFILNALGGFEWSLASQFRYNIRIITNSWGSSGRFNPNNPINIATKLAADRNIVVVFSASNAGPGWDTHNTYGKAPWVISVAAGTKEGGLAAFSSRGTPKAQRLANDDPHDDFDAPRITAPGTGRQFATNPHFTTDIVAARATTNVVANGLTDDTAIPPAFLPFYTQISGTSMAAPHVAGVAALVLEANPSLSAAEVRDILLRTATRMPGLEEFETGAGYVNAHAAVDLAFKPSKAYGTFLDPSFHAVVDTVWSAAEPHTVNYVPAPPGPDSPNTFRFAVEPGINLLSVIADFGRAPVTDEVGNAMGLVLWPPDCQAPMEPTGQRPACVYSSGIALPLLNSPKRQVVVRNPQAGEWIAEFGGVRGLAALPEASSPIGIALPDRIDAGVSRASFHLAPVADVAGHDLEDAIVEALLNRRSDLRGDGRFHPDEPVTREDLARHLALVVPLRQTLADTPRFGDVPASFGPIAEAVTARGATLRDWNFESDGLMSAAGGSFIPGGLVTRLDVAVAFVRALGKDAEAKAGAGAPLAAADGDDVPAALRGYVQLALNLGLLDLEEGLVNPDGGLTRAMLARTVNVFAGLFGRM
jgi:serine protease AprX